MKSFHLRFTACLLVSALVGTDPAWAAIASVNRPRLRPSSLSSTVWRTQACNAPSIEGWVGHPGAEQLRRQEGAMTRRELANVSLGVLIAHLLFGRRARAQTSASPVSLPDASRHKDLLPRLAAKSIRFRAALQNFRIKQDHLDAMAARDEIRIFMQGDLTHSPRIPLGTSAATPGPFRPSYKDVIARIDNEIHGPLKAEETRLPKAEPHRKGFWPTFVAGLKRAGQAIETGALDGGWMFSSKTTQERSLNEFYQAAIDVQLADAEAFKVLEEEWQKGYQAEDGKHVAGLEEAWFELAAIDVDIRRIETQIRFKEREITDQAIHIKTDFATTSGGSSAEGRSKKPPVPPEETAKLSAMEEELRTFQKELGILGQKQTAQASVVALKRLIDDDVTAETDAEKYRALPPQIQPTLAFVNAILLSAGQKLDTGKIAAFQAALRPLLLFGDELPADPYTPAGRTLAFNRAWPVEGSNATIPAAEIARDNSHGLPLAKIGHWMDEGGKDRLVLQVQPSPEQAILGFKIRHVLQLINFLKLNFLREWVIKIFFKLGLDLPLQTSINLRQPMTADQTKRLIKEQEDSIEYINLLIKDTKQSNETSVIQARQALIAAHANLVKSARDSVDVLGKVAREIDSQAAAEAYRFEQQIFDLEKNALELQKAYWRLAYLVEGRQSLRRLVDQERDAFMDSRPQAKPTAVSPVPAAQESLKEDKELAVPKTGKEKKPPKGRAAPGVGGKAAALILLKSATAAAATLQGTLVAALTVNGSSLQPSFIPHWLQWAFIIGLIHWTIWHPHYSNDLEEKDRTDRVMLSLAGFGLAILFFFPGSHWLGLGVAAATVALAWITRPEALVTLRPYSPLYVAAHTFNRRTWFRRYSKTVIFGAIGLWVLDPIGNAILWLTSKVYRRLVEEVPATSGVGVSPIRLALSHAPLEEAVLVRAKKPTEDTHILSARYLVRYIGPNDAIPDDAVFVFQSNVDPASIKAKIAEAQAEVRSTEAGLAALASRTVTEEVIQEAKTRISMAESELAALQAKQQAFFQPMPEGLPLEVDTAYPMITDQTPATVGVPLLLAVIKPSRAIRFEMVLTPGQTATIGTAKGAPDRHMRMVVQPVDGGSEYRIPVAAMPQLEKASAEGSSLSTLLRDPAKGGFREFRLIGDFLLTDNLLKLPDGEDFTPPETLQFVKDLSDGKPGTPQALKVVRFEEYKGSGQWQDFEENVEGKVVALMELESTEAAGAQTTVPKQTAAINVREIQTKLGQAQRRLQELLDKQTALDKRRGTPAARRAQLDNAALIPPARAEVANFEAQLVQGRASVQMKATQGTVIGARQTQLLANRRWIFAKWPIARRLNAWTERFSNGHVPAGRLPKDVVDWDPEALQQVSDRPSIKVASALRQYASINKAQAWKVTFLGREDRLDIPRVFRSNVNDPMMDLSDVVLRQDISLEKARQLFPEPGSVVPVLVELPSGSKFVDEKKYREAQPLLSQHIIFETVAGLAALGAMYLALLTYRLRNRIRKPTVKPVKHVYDPYYEGTDWKPSYLNGNIPHKLPMMDRTSLQDLRKLLKTTYLPYASQNEWGEPLKPWQNLHNRYKQAGLSKGDGKFHVNSVRFDRTKGKADKETTRAKWVWLFEALITLPILLSDRAYQILHDAFLPGQFTWVVFQQKIQQLAIDIAASRGPDFFRWQTLVTHPQAFAELGALAVKSFPEAFAGLAFITVVWAVINTIAQALARKVPTTWVWMRYSWYKIIRRKDRRQRKFLKISAEVDPDGKEVSPEVAVKRVLQDMDAVNEGITDVKLGNSRPFIGKFMRFSAMLTERASINLEESADAYVDEKPENLDAAHQAYDSPARAMASEARTWAAALRETARNQGTPQALIPPNSDFDIEDLHFDDQDLEEIAVQRLGMNLKVIERNVARLAKSETEIRKRVKRIHEEYIDRAKVFWAISEMRSCPISSLWTLETYDLTGLALRPLPPYENSARDRRLLAAFREAEGVFQSRTRRDLRRLLTQELHEHDPALNEALDEAAGTFQERTGISLKEFPARLLQSDLAFVDARQEAEKHFQEVRGDVDNVLEEFRQRLPTLSEQSAWLRPKFLRQTDTLQMIYYLNKGFGENDRLRPERQDRLLKHMLGDKEKPDNIGLIRDVDDYDVPTFEALALRFYLRGPWPQKLADEVRDALISLKGYSLDGATEKMQEIEASLRRQSTRRFMSTAVSRRLRKDASEHFDEFLVELYDTSSSERNENDLRFLAEPVAIQDAEKNNKATTADIVIADLRDSNFLDQVLAYLGEPLFGNLDFFGDLALRSDAREGAIDLGNETRWITGQAHYVSMVEPLDPFAALLSGRMESRTPPEQSKDTHVFSSAQTDDILPEAGRRRPGSILEVSVEPANIARALDPARTDESLFIWAPPNAHLKKSARVIYIDELRRDAQALFDPMDATPERIEERLHAEDVSSEERDVLEAQRVVLARRKELREYLSSEQMAPATRENLTAVYKRIYTLFSRLKDRRSDLYDDYLSRVEETRSFLERMNVNFRRSLVWTPEILDEVPAEDSDKSYNTIEMIYPHVRPPYLDPNQSMKLDSKLDGILDEGDLKEAGLTLVQEGHVTKGAGDLVSSAWFGEGGMGAVYRVHKGSVTFPKLLTKGFFELRDAKNRLLAFRYFQRNDVQIGAEIMPVIYHSWTTVNKAVRRQGVAGTFSRLTLEKFREMLGGKGAAIANIEFDNTPSVKTLVRRGYVSIAEFNVGYVSQLFPNGFVSWFLSRLGRNQYISQHFRENIASWLRRRGTPENVRRATVSDRSAILKLLQDTYRGYNFTDFDPATFNPMDDYYVWVDNHKITAVIKAKKQHWEFKKLKAWLPKLVGDHLHFMGPLLTLPLYFVLSRLFPLLLTGPQGVGLLLLAGLLLTLPLRWLFNLKSMHYLRIGDVAYESGHAQAAKKLVQAAMAENQVHIAWGFFDRKGPVYRELGNAHTWGPTGLLNLAAETKMHTYAYPFDEESRRIVEALHQNLEKKRPVKPAFIPSRHLGWWLAPFAALSALLLGTAHSGEAATLVPTASLSLGHVTAQATTSAFHFVVQVGDSPWAIARRLLGAGLRYTEIFGKDPSILHPGEVFQLPGWTDPVLPHAPVPHMTEIPLAGWEQWLLHPHWTPELIWIAAAVAGAGLLFWLWKSGRLQRLVKSLLSPAQRPAWALVLATAALAHSVAPNIFNRPEPPKPVMTFAAGRFKDPAPDLSGMQILRKAAQDITPSNLVPPNEEIPRVATAFQEAPPQEQQASAPTSQAGQTNVPNGTIQPTPVMAGVSAVSPLTAPPKPILVMPKEKRARPWVHYANKVIGMAQGTYAAVKTSPPTAADEVKLLRLKYLALYGRRMAESLSSKPLTPDFPAPRPQRLSFLQRANPWRIVRPGLGLLDRAASPVTKRIVKFINRHALAPEPLDVRMEALRAEIRESIRTVKRDQILAGAGLLWAERALAQDPSSLMARRNVEACRIAAQDADKRARELRDELTQSRPIEGLPEADRFENAFNPSKLLEDVAPGTSELPKDLAEIEDQASQGLTPIKGTEKMGHRQKETTLAQERDAQQSASLLQTLRIREKGAEAAVRLALAEELRHLGLVAEAAQAAQQALRLARDHGLLPRDVVVDLERAGKLSYLGQENDVPQAAQFALQAARDDERVLSFHGPVNFVDVADESLLKTRNPPLYAALQPLFEAARQARKDFATTAHDAAVEQSKWEWKGLETTANRLNPSTLYLEERAGLLNALERESDVRTKLRAAESVLPKAADMEPEGLQLTVIALEIPEMPYPGETPSYYLAPDGMNDTIQTGGADSSPDLESVSVGKPSAEGTEPLVKNAPSVLAVEASAKSETGGRRVHAPAPRAALQSRLLSRRTLTKRVKTPSRPANPSTAIVNPENTPKSRDPLGTSLPEHPDLSNREEPQKPSSTPQMEPANTTAETPWYRMMDFWAAMGSVLALGIMVFAFLRAKSGKSLFGLLGPFVLFSHLSNGHFQDRHPDLLTHSA